MTPLCQCVRYAGMALWGKEGEGGQLDGIVRCRSTSRSVRVWNKRVSSCVGNSRQDRNAVQYAATVVFEMSRSFEPRLACCERMPQFFAPRWTRGSLACSSWRGAPVNWGRCGSPTQYTRCDEHYLILPCCLITASLPNLVVPYPPLRAGASSCYTSSTYLAAGYSRQLCGCPG